MHLYELPLIFSLIGLVLYVVLAGADFGAGFWQLSAGRGVKSVRIRDHAHDSMAAVWEANHVWLIFVLTVVWTAYPVAFGSIASTLSIPLFIAAIGIIFRGGAYALRAGSPSLGELRAIDSVTAIASIITPFALGAAVGGIASGRVPVGNASGDLVTSWLNPTSILIGILAVATSAYLAAVFLAADAVRQGEHDLEDHFRVRALASGVVAGAIAVAGLAVLHSDVHSLYEALVKGPGLPALIVSIAAGLGTLILVWRRIYEPARYSAAVAVAAIIVGWALAQEPTFLPGLTVKEAAAPYDTLVAVVVAVVVGAAILFPSLALLFRLVLRGQLDDSETIVAPAPRTAILSASGPGLVARSAGACFLAGIVFLTIADAGWAHAIGLAALLAFILLGFVAVAPADLAIVNEEKQVDAPGSGDTPSA
jgi:cytochrome bd ubiquinol oxidase subunit II